MMKKADWVSDGLEARSVAATLKIYLFGIAVLLPIVSFAYFRRGEDIAIHLVPLLVASLIGLEYARNPVVRFLSRPLEPLEHRLFEIEYEVRRLESLHLVGQAGIPLIGASLLPVLTYEFPLLLDGQAVRERDLRVFLRSWRQKSPWGVEPHLEKDEELSFWLTVTTLYQAGLIRIERAVGTEERYYNLSDFGRDWVVRVK